MKPIEVFALDAKMNRATLSIPYKSLEWHRCYYEFGDFTLEVPADIYDQSWKFIYTDERPETGIIEKVSYTDDPKYGNVDTVTLKGRFLESIMNRRTFLDETQEEVTYRYYVSPPTPPKEELEKPSIYKDADGNYWYETPSGTTYGVADGAGDDITNRRPGSAVQTDESGQKYIETGSGRVNVEDETYMTQINSYYYTDGASGTVNRVQNTGTGNATTTHDVAFSDGFGNTYYHDSSTGTLKRATGVTEKQEDNYVVKYNKWKSSTDNGWVEVTETVKGPWQITGTFDPITPMDNIARCVQWAQMYFQNDMLFIEPEFTGVEKTVDPSFQLLGDLLYSELQTVGASFRVHYDFINAQFIFSVIKGLDRTQDQEIPEPEPIEPIWLTTGKVQSAEIETMKGSSVGRTIIYGASKPGEPRLPEGYTELEYIESDGNSFVSTGVNANQTTGYELDAYIPNPGDTGNHHILTAYESGNYCGLRFDTAFSTYQARWGGFALSDIPNSGKMEGRHLFKLENGSYSIDGGTPKTFGSATFSHTGPLCLFGQYAIGNSTYGQGSKAKVYSLVMWSNGEKVRDFVPCKEISTGNSGLFDLVSMSFFGRVSGTGLISPGPDAETTSVPMEDVALSINGKKWNIDLGGNTLGEGKTLTIKRDGKASIDGISIPDQTIPTMPERNVSIINDSSIPHYFDVEYQKYQEQQESTGNPWAVFSDEWGTLYGYSADKDESNYRNKCFVLYDYEAPTEWEGNRPKANPVYEWKDGISVLVGYQIPYERNRGFETVRLEDGEDDKETYIDLRDDPPACDGEWSRDMYPAEEGVPDLPEIKSQYDNYKNALKTQGKNFLMNDHPKETSLDTGQLEVYGYLKDFDLGDKVDMAVSTIGIVQTGRITEISEVYDESGSSVQISLSETELEEV